jgi:uncharacterized repeat protein (TIGR03843 family)
VSASELSPPPAGLDHAAILAHLANAELEITGRLVDASNATLYGTADGVEVVYKPVRGERPLWDFPDGTLAGREHAAYLVSRAAGWDVVPPTLLRDGPFGAGMVQMWVSTDPSVELEELIGRAEDPWLRSMALFDAVVNNTDRKGGHLLPMVDGTILGCDHGLTFHVEDKLRTVLWQWRGEALTAQERRTLVRLDALLAGSLGTALHDELTRREVRAAQARVQRLLAEGTMPWPSGDWPAVPWPPF